MQIAPRILYTWKVREVDHRLVIWRDGDTEAPVMAFTVERKSQDALGSQCWTRVTVEQHILNAFNYLFFALYFNELAKAGEGADKDDLSGGK